MNDLFPHTGTTMQLSAGTFLLQGYALAAEVAILQEIAPITAASPLRQMVTPGGFKMSVAMTNCGALGWITDRKGYRYSAIDPLTQKPWPAMPSVFADLANKAASTAGYQDFRPDACLINCYSPGARMSLHQDKDEQDFSQPIVSVSLGIPAIFQFGGLARADKTMRITLQHGDVIVWGGQDRLRFHGILPLKPAQHPLLADQRINLTFRKAG